MTGRYATPRGTNDPDPAWRQQAACANPALGTDRERTDMFYTSTERTRGRALRAKTADEEAAARVCDGCPVRADCLEHALSTREPFGVRGGMTPDERSHLARVRAAAAAS